MLRKILIALPIAAGFAIAALAPSPADACTARMPAGKKPDTVAQRGKLPKIRLTRCHPRPAIRVVAITTPAPAQAR